MARVKQTARDPYYQEEDTEGIPPNEEETAVREPSEDEEASGSSETSGDNVDETAVQGRSPPGGIPSSPGSSILEDSEESEEGGGEETAGGAVSGRDGGGTASTSSSEESSSLSPLVNSEDEEREAWNNDGDPFRIRMSAKDRLSMERGLEVFLTKRRFGDGYTIRVPSEQGTVAWPDARPNANRFFGCYEAAFLAGVRFPLHGAIKAILRGYGLGVWQLTPNSWVNILGYIAACEMQGLNPGWEAFAHMNYLSRSPGGWRAWYTLTTLPKYLMTLDKPSKWPTWKSRFYIGAAPTRQENAEYRLYNKKPDLLGQKCALPKVPAGDYEQILETGFFELTTVPLSTGELISVPKNWVPKHEWLRDECFLSACGLSTMFDRRMDALYRLSCLQAVSIL